MRRFRPKTAILTVTVLILQPLLPPQAWAIQEPITETLLQQPQGAPAPGRLWPGFAAAKGVDTGATADPNGAKPEQIDTGASAEPTGQPPTPVTSSLTAPGLGAGSGGDLSSTTAPWLGSGAAAPNTPSTQPLTGGVPTLGGVSLGGGTPLGGGLSSPNLGNLAAGLLGSSLGNMGGAGGAGGIPGLDSIMGMVGMLSILNSLPQMLQMLPQMVQFIAQMAGSIFQVGQALWQALGGDFQGLMGLAGQLGMAGMVPSGQAGGVAGSVPSQMPSGFPPSPSGPGNTSVAGGFNPEAAWNTCLTDNAGPNYCGRGVYNILSSQGHSVIPGNGQDWNENLASLGWSRVKISDPSQAPIGSVLVYESSGGTNGGGAQWGHVEVVSRSPSGGRTYLAGTSSSVPGGTVPQNWDGYAWLPPGGR